MSARMKSTQLYYNLFFIYNANDTFAVNLMWYVSNVLLTFKKWFLFICLFIYP